MTILTHHATYKNQGLIRNSYKTIKKRLNIIRNPEDWLDGYVMALEELNKEFMLSEKRMEKVKNIGHKYFLSDNNISRSRYVIGATALFIVMKLDGEIVTLKEFSIKSNVSKTSLSKCLRDMDKKLDLNGEFSE